MKTNINLLSLIILCFSLLFFPKAIYAADNLVINEFSANTSPDWIELYNAGDENVDLTKYILQDSTSEIYKFDSGVLEPQKYLVVEVDSRLDKAKDIVKLVYKIDEEHNSVAEEIPYGTNGIVAAPSETQSVGKDVDGTGNFILITNPTMGFSNCNPTCPIPIPTVTSTPTPTPTIAPTPTPSSVPTPTSTPSVGVNSIYITEVYPSPLDGEHEWVEIINSNDFVVNLDGWYFKDASNNKISISDREISENSRIYIENNGSQILNNNGDTVFLMNPDNNAINSLSNSYPEIPKGKSWAKVGDDWCIAVPSKGETNTQCQDQTIATATTTNTPKPSVKASSTPRPSPKETSESQELNDDSNSRQLPVLGDQDINIQASESGSKSKANSKLLLPLGIAGSGLVLLGGSLTALTKPEIFASIIKTIINR